MRRLALLFSTCTCVLLASAQNNSLNDRIRRVENHLIPYVPVQGFAPWTLIERMRYYQVPGVSIAVIRDYKIDWAKGYGLADTTTRRPVDVNTLFSAGSISKLVTAVIALRLVERGVLSLDAPINNYLKRWKLVESEFYKKRPVTLRMLLSHTGGTSQSVFFGFLPTRHQLPDIVQILRGDSIAESNRVVVNSEPGKEFRYSGGGYMIVQLAIMEALNADFNFIAQQEVFAPLDMRKATFQQPLPESAQSSAAWGYSDAGWYKGVPYVSPQ